MKNEEIERLDFSAWPLPDEYLIELGRVAALWATLESFLNICIGKLAGFNEFSDPKPFILVNHASVPQKIDMPARFASSSRQSSRISRTTGPLSLKSAPRSGRATNSSTMGSLRTPKPASSSWPRVRRAAR